MEIRSSALCHVDLPFSWTAPYSVTMKSVHILGVVTMAPSFSTGVIREYTLPLADVLVEGVQRKLSPPSDPKAPITKSSWPPVPEIWR